MDQLPPERLKMLEESFKKIDKDGSGQMSKAEYRKFLKSVGIKMSKEEVDKCFSTVDKDNTGEIDFEEFCKLSCSMGIGGPAVKVEEKKVEEKKVEEEPVEKKTVLRAGKKTKKVEKVEYQFDEKALTIEAEIKKLRSKPSSVIVEMDDGRIVANEKLALNGDLAEFCKQCLEELGQSEDPLRQEGSANKFGNLVIQNAENVEGPVKLFIYYGDYDSAEELLRKIILKDGKIEEEIAKHFVDPIYTALGVGYYKPEDPNKQAMTMIAFIANYVPKEAQ